MRFGGQLLAAEGVHKVNELLKERIVRAWQSLPESIKGRAASDDELRDFEQEYGTTIPPEFRWFLLACGACPIGSEWVDGIKELHQSHEKFAKESNAPNCWTMKDVFIIGWDGGGNPFGICAKTGRVLVEDHDFGGIHEMASSFENFLKKGLLGGD
jgi:hypothetical protein